MGGGRNFTSPATGDFTNQGGAIDVGSTSTFTVGGSHNYVQTSGGLETSVLGVLAASQIKIQGGMLDSVRRQRDCWYHPGRPAELRRGPSRFFQTISQAPSARSPGHLERRGQLYSDVEWDPQHVHRGSKPGHGGHGLFAAQHHRHGRVGGTLDISLSGGFQPYDGETFTLLTSDGISGAVSTFLGLQQGNYMFTIDPNNDLTVEAHFVGTVPEPSSVVILGLGVAGVGACVAWKSKRRIRRQHT